VNKLRTRNIRVNLCIICDPTPLTLVNDILAFQENLKQCLGVRLPGLLTQRNIRLVVIDSIAGLFRSDYDPSDAINRAKDLQMVGGQLHKLADQFHLAVICVNQVPFSST
jgi:RecA/RadA recombinase